LSHLKGVLYNPKKVDTNETMAPPYDIITPEFKEVLYKKSPYNIIRIDFGKDEDADNENENRYTRASKCLSDWLNENILINNTEPSFLLLRNKLCYKWPGPKDKGLFRSSQD